MAYEDAINALFPATVRATAVYAVYLAALHERRIGVFASGGVSIDYRFDGTKATVTTHTNEDSVTIGDHERGNPVLVSPTKKTYTLDKFAYIDELVPVHMIEQIQAPIVQSRANAAADAVAAQLNTEIRTQLLASTDATLLLTAIAVTSANWGNTAHQGDVIGAFEDARDEATLSGLQGSLGCITSVEVGRVVKDYLKRVKLPFVEGILENALVRVNVIRWEGFDIIQDASAGSGTTNADDDKHALFFIAPGDNSPVVFAARAPQPRTFQSETYRGTRIVDEISYGADVIYPERGRIAKHAIA